MYILSGSFLQNININSSKYQTCGTEVGGGDVDAGCKYKVWKY